MKQYVCNNIVQVAHKIAEITNTSLDRTTWKQYCYDIKRNGSDWIDYIAFDKNDNEYDISIFLGYDKSTKQYIVEIDD